MPGDELDLLTLQARIPDIRPGISAVQHDFAGHRV
jgi:hypothetical protein